MKATSTVALHTTMKPSWNITKHCTHLVFYLTFVNLEFIIIMPAEDQVDILPSDEQSKGGCCRCWRTMSTAAQCTLIFIPILLLAGSTCAMTYLYLNQIHFGTDGANNSKLAFCLEILKIFYYQFQF